MTYKSRYIEKIRDLQREIDASKVKFKKTLSSQKKRFASIINSQYFHRDRLNEAQFFLDVVKHYMIYSKTSELSFKFKGKGWEDFEYTMKKDWRL